MHDVCLRKIAPQTTATRHFSTTYDHITDSITTVSFYISGYLTPPALRHKSYTEPDRHSVLFCSVSSQPTRHTRHILPAASRYCNALFCHTPFNSIPAGQPPPIYPTYHAGHQSVPQCSVLFCSALPVQFHSGLHPLTDRLPMAMPFYSAMLHSGMPSPQSTHPILPAASMYRTVLFCAASSIPFRLTPSYRLTAASPCPYSALFHLGMPDPPDHTRPYQTYPTYPAYHDSRRSVPQCRLSSGQFRSGLLAYRLNAASPCHSILLCFILVCPPLNLPNLSCRPPVCTALSCSVLPVQFRSGLHPLTD